MNNTDVKVSILMGIYNPREKYQLLEAVSSIIQQDFQEWELILYDDGSDISHTSIILEAAKLDRRIHYVRGKENHGLAYALNQAFQYAKGDYIARMDDDDISEPDRLSKQYMFLLQHPEYQWVASNSRLFDEHGIWGVDQRPEIPSAKDFLLYSPYIHPSVMFRRSVLEESGGYLVAGMTQRCEDYELFMRLHCSGYQGYNIQEPLLQYREDSNAYQKRKAKYRIREMQARFLGFRKLGILNLRTFPYVIKPLAVGAVPAFVLKYVKKKTKRGKDYVSHCD